MRRIDRAITELSRYIGKDHKNYLASLKRRWSRANAAGDALSKKAIEAEVDTRVELEAERHLFRTMLHLLQVASDMASKGWDDGEKP
jgi:hypothetical protein